MRQKLTLQEAQDFYKKSNIRQTQEGFEIPDEACEVTTVVLEAFHVFLDGELIDPAELLVDCMGRMRRELFKTSKVCAPVSLSYAFGKSAIIDGQRVFYMRDPMRPTLDAMDVMVEAEWNMRQGVLNQGWVEEVEKNWGGRILHQKEVSFDGYKSRGKQVWILSATDEMTEILNLKNDFYKWQRKTIDDSNKALKKFEAEKDSYKKKIIEYLGWLEEDIHWIKASEEEELWPKYDANRELWEQKKYGWQVIEFDDYLEVRGRGGSPGEITMIPLRYDEVGLEVCHKFVGQNT